MAYGLTKSAHLVAASTQTLSVATNASVEISGNFTIEGWFKFATTGGCQMVSKWADSISWARASYEMGYSAGSLSLSVSNGSTGGAVTVSWTPTAGVWYHIAAVYTTGGTADFYVNGVQVGTQQTGLVTSVYSANTFPFRIGSNLGASDTPTNLFDGDVSLVRLWKEARTVTQIANNMCSVLGTTTNLSGEWKLDDALTDNSGNSNTLTNNNSATFTTALPSVCTVAVYNQTVAAVGAGVSVVLKGITAATTVLHATGAGVGSVTKQLAQTLTSLGSSTANVLKQMGVTITSTGVGSATVDAIRVTLQTLDAVGQGVATMTIGIGKTLTSTGAGVAEITKITGKILSVTAVGVGVATMTKQLSYTLTAVGTGVATLTPAILKTLSAIGNGVATLVKTPGKLLSSTGTGSATIVAGRAVIMNAVGVGIATLGRATGKVLNAIGVAHALIAKDFWKTKYTKQSDTYTIKYPHGQ